MPPPTPPPRRALVALSPNAPVSFDIEATKSPARGRRGSAAARRKLSAVTASQVVWRGWLRKQSGAKQSGKSGFTVGSLMRKWNRRYFVVRRSEQHAASIEWYRSEDITVQPQHSVSLTGGALRPAGGCSEDCALVLQPMEPHTKGHRVALKREGDFVAFSAALAACGVAVELPAINGGGHQRSGSASDAAPSERAPSVAALEAAETIDTVAVDDNSVQLAHFAQAVAASVRRLHDPLAHTTEEIRVALKRLMSVTASAGIAVRSRQLVLTADVDGAKLGLRLEVGPGAAEAAVQVRDVVDGGLAAGQGIEAGMILNSINGCAVTGWNISDIEAVLTSTPRPFTLTFCDYTLGTSTTSATSTEAQPLRSIAAGISDGANFQQWQPKASMGGNSRASDKNDSSSSSSSSEDDDDDDDGSSCDEEPVSKASLQSGHKRGIGAAMSTDSHTCDLSRPSQRPRRNAMVIGQQPTADESAGASAPTRKQQLQQQLQQQREQQRQRVGGSQRSLASAMSVSSTGSCSPGAQMDDSRARAANLQRRREERRFQHGGSQRSISSALSISSGSSSPGAPGAPGEEESQVHLEDPRSRAAKLQSRCEARRGRIQQAQEMMRAGEVEGLLKAVENEERFEV